MTSENKFTPGKWYLDHHTSATSIKSSTDNKLVIAGECDGWMAPFACREDEEEAIANARLVAAAPDLFAALEAAVEYDNMLRELKSPDSYLLAGSEPLIDLAYDKMMDMARVAIAKARGDQ